MAQDSINQRAQELLKILVENYIQDGSPIGSKTLAEKYSLGLSSATIRNILADLEENGYLTSPHTSSGRIPTPRGYRFFVNRLLTVKSFDSTGIDTSHYELNPDLNLENLLVSASSLLSSLTQMAGIVALPKRNRIALRQVEFLSLSANRVLVILVLNNREVQNRILYTDKVYTHSELQQIGNYLTSNYAGKDLLAIRKDLTASIRAERDDMQLLFQTAIDMANQVFNGNITTNDYVIAGQNHLLNYSKQADLERLRALFEAINQKQEILNLLDQALEADGVQIFIGKESGSEALGDCSIVATSYSVDGQLLGGLGVIGPTRMPYERVISAVDVTAKLLSAALNQS